MKRALQFVVHNWPLKLAAALLAIFLYAGLILSQSAQVWPGSVPIIPLRLPTTAVLLGNLPSVTSIRYFAPADVAQLLSSSSFTATVDLSQAQPQSGSPFVIVRVVVTATDPRVKVLDYEPPSIQVRLDPLVSKLVPIAVDHGTVPPGIEIRAPALSASQALVSGPESIVRLVTAAQARVIVQPSGIDVDQTVDLVAVDIRGEAMGPVNLRPSSVHVKIAVGSGLQSKTLPVNPVIAGTPAVGYQIASVAVNPVVVTVVGDANALALLSKVDTLPVSVGGATSGVNQTVGLALPDGVSALAEATITVTVAIQAQAATRDYSAGLVLSGARDDRTYALSTGSVLVTLGGTVASLDTLDPSSFSVVVDVDGLGLGSHKVKVTVSLPADVQLVAVSPAQVTVTVIANPAASPSNGP